MYGSCYNEERIHKFLRFYFSVFSSAFDSIEKIHQALKTVFDRISKHLEVRQKYSLRVVFSILFSVFRNVVKYGLLWSRSYLRVQQAVKHHVGLQVR